MLRRFERIICAVVLAMLLATSATPAFAKSVTAKVKVAAKVYKKAGKKVKSAKLKKGTKLKVTAVAGSWARVTMNGKTGYMPKKYLQPASSAKKSGSKKSAAKSGSAKKNAKKSARSWKAKVVKMNWYNGGSSVLKKGKYGAIYDIDTGITLKIKRMGGHNHADVEPATTADTAKLLKVAGGHFSWDSHAVILKAGGKYVASAINTKPHGDQTIRSNHYDGQFCLHMTDSKTHGSQKENREHQKSIQRAYKWAHS